MVAQNEILLQETYDNLINVALCVLPAQRVEGVISGQFMSYGTAVDEEVYRFEGLKWMVERSKKELGDVKYEVKRYPKFRNIFSHGYSALFIEEVEVFVGEGADTISIRARVSTLCEYINDKWMIHHFHISTPDANTQEGEAWPIEEWKRKNKELEQLVAEKTADLAKQSAKLKEEKERLELTLSELKIAQEQLIHSEKMASLGELTAGIAHEIQNPLNFVNNFSEVNTELLDELQGELTTGNSQEAMVLAKDIKENELKIHLHGKRADAIVKAMLQHSGANSGQKEPTDINVLADEYLRLSYHGLRAKDKSFTAVLETHFDPSVGEIEVFGQDIGRVLLNLFNNAFYSVNEKRKTLNDSYKPEVQVSTEKHGGQVYIKIKDNGTGIPEKLLSKIYQPFFTTKPAGEGTGLGLSLSYDIITKGHGGEMKVETREGEGSEFKIQLPIR